MMRQLQERTDALEARAAEQEAFIHSVSHVLKTPLSSILAAAEIVQEELAEASDDSLDGLSLIVRNGERMRDIIEDLLQLARATAGLNDLVLEPVSLDDVLRAVQHELFAQLHARDAQLEIQRPLPVVNGHAGRLTEVFTNLIDNAIKYTPSERQPRVQVSGCAENGMVTCVISDNGVGIAAGDRERIFGLLERINGSGDTTPGSGVGLAVAARVVERHGGRISVEDSLQGGSSFRLTLPMP